MIQQMSNSEDNVLGYRVVGDVTKEDYGTLVPSVEAAVKQYGAIRLLIDMSDFTWEKVDAWGSDFGFGKEFKNSIERMALAHDRDWLVSVSHDNCVRFWDVHDGLIGAGVIYQWS